MSSFFTHPTAQRKRKRKDQTLVFPSQKGLVLSNASRKGAPSSSKNDEESVSGSDVEATFAETGSNGDSDSTEPPERGDDNETGERRLKLAERYLKNVAEDLDETRFDAADIDKDLIASRLRQDVAELKGRLFRRLASRLSVKTATSTHVRLGQHAVTAVAVHPPYAYTASKDRMLVKWDLTPCVEKGTSGTMEKEVGAIRCQPRKVVSARGNKSHGLCSAYNGHTSKLLCVSVSPDGRYVATGGADRRLIIWQAEDLKPVKVFTQHRDDVTALAFRRGTNQLYSSSSDRTVKLWSLDELSYVETLYGHQDAVVDIAALATERCVSVGARDRTVRLWKVIEESQLVFRGGGAPRSTRKRQERGDTDVMSDRGTSEAKVLYSEGSIDCVAMIDEETFVTGSDSGSISLWNMHKKKPIFTVPVAHGVDQPMASPQNCAQSNGGSPNSGPALPRWITALATVPYSDLIFSGSWDGCIKVWKVTSDKKRLEEIGRLEACKRNTDKVRSEKSAVKGSGRTLGKESDPGMTPNSLGIINGISVFEREPHERDGLVVVAVVGKEHRLGRWLQMGARDGMVIFDVLYQAGNTEHDEHP